MIQFYFHSKHRRTKQNNFQFNPKSDDISLATPLNRSRVLHAAKMRGTISWKKRLKLFLMSENFPFAATRNEKQMDWVRWRFYGQTKISEPHECFSFVFEWFLNPFNWPEINWNRAANVFVLISFRFRNFIPKLNKYITKSIGRSIELSYVIMMTLFSAFVVACLPAAARLL